MTNGRESRPSTRSSASPICSKTNNPPLASTLAFGVATLAFGVATLAFGVATLAFGVATLARAWGFRRLATAATTNQLNHLHKDYFMNMKPIGHWLLAVAVLSSLGVSCASAEDAPTKSAPFKVLVVAGGCCHDYATQSRLLKEGIESRLNADVTVDFNPEKTTKTTFEIYQSDDWADGYDVVVHDECSADVTDEAYVGRILAAHRNGTPAVNLHCAMHSYRWGDFHDPVEPGAENAGWYEMIGLQSTGHGPQFPINVTYSDTDHPITQGLEDWTTINEELYNNIRVFDGTTALASGKQTIPPNKRQLKQNPNAKGRVSESVVAWTNEYGPNKTKIFSTTLGHQNETVADARYMDLVVRGLLWSTGNLTEDGKPVAAVAK